MTSFIFFRYRHTARGSRTVGRDDWIDLFAMLTAPLRRRSGLSPSPAYFRLPLLLVEQLPRWFVSMPSASLKQKNRHKRRIFVLMVGMTGFEPATTCTPCKCATRLRYIPNSNIYIERLTKKSKTFFIKYKI